jgi:type II secretory pathway pseudopilin PulG
MATLIRTMSTPRNRRAGLLKAGRRARGFTLIEVLLIVALLGIAGVLVIPSMNQAGALRVQAGVRTLVSDISFLQAEAIAFQSRRAIWFGKVGRLNPDTGAWEFIDGNGYTMAEVTGPELTLSTNALTDPDDPRRPFFRDFSGGEYGGAVIGNAQFNGGELLIFDEIGGTVAELDGPEPGDGGEVTIEGSGSQFVVSVQPYSGRVIVTRTRDLPEDEDQVAQAPIN